MIEDDILKALQSAAMVAAALTSIPDIAIKNVGRTSIEKPDGTEYKGDTWLEFVHIINNPSDLYWGTEKQYQGAFRILLHWPNKDTGLYRALAYLSEIAIQFNKAQRLNSGAASVQLIQNPDVSGDIGGGTELILPLTLQYRSVALAA